MKISLKHIFFTIFAMILAGCLVFFTLAFSRSLDTNGVGSGSGALQYSLVTLNTTESGSTIESSLLKGDANPEGKIFEVNFGRLASAFVLPRSGFSTPQDEIQTNQDGSYIQIGNAVGIFSWYDPFKSYVLSDVQGTYRINQITNGSIYVGHEDDGTVSLYSIDLVAELTFLANGQDMTKIIIFPGMYLRFDPKGNTGLKNADLFRIMLALKNTDSDANTGIEFVDPRINASAGKDVFFMYRLSSTTRPLFEFLHVAFLKHAEDVNLLESYRKSNTNYFGGNSKNILNPTKSEFQLLGELQMIFSQAVGDEMSTSDFAKRITEIKQQAEEYKVDTKIRAMIEQFLIDGRFALFLNNKNSQIQEIYNEAAKLVGIVPTSGKGKLFQSLSNIFSRNLLENTSASNLDNYILAVNEIRNTLSNTAMDTNDYFDMSLYAYLMFEKMTDGGKMIEANVLSTDTLYQLYISIFRATQKYIDGLPDASMRTVAEKSLVLHFYEPMLSVLLRTLYGTDTTIRDGAIYLEDKWVNRDATLFMPNFIGNLEAVLAEIRGIFNNKIVMLYTGGNEMLTKNTMEQSLASLEGFIAMIKPGAYKTYQNDPYLSDDTTYHLPRYDATKKTLISQSSKDATEEINSGDTVVPSSEPEIVQMTSVLAKLLGITTLSSKDIQKTSNGFLVTMRNDNIKYTFIYIPTSMSMQNIIMTYDGLPPIRVLDTLSIGSFKSFLFSGATYGARVQKIYQDDPTIPKTIVNLYFSRNQILIGEHLFVLNL